MAKRFDPTAVAVGAQRRLSTRAPALTSEQVFDESGASRTRCRSRPAFAPRLVDQTGIASAGSPAGSAACQRVLHDAELSGAESGLGAIADVEFGEDVGDVVLDGAFGEAEA